MPIDLDKMPEPRPALDPQLAGMKIKLVHRPTPPYYSFCSSCYTQHLDDKTMWVDCGAAWDGGTIVNEMGTVVGTVDDLRLCINCARQVGRAIGMEYQSNLENELKEMKAKLLETEQRLKKIKKDVSDES